MRKKQLGLFISFLILAVVAWICGCEQRMSVAPAEDVNNTAAIEDYFPLSTGKTSLYISTNSGYDPVIITKDKFVIGQGIEEGDQYSYAWIHTDLDYQLITDTSYFYQTGDALYYYETADSDPEIILKAPLEVGNSWLRYSITSFDEDNNLFELLLESQGTKYTEPEIYEEDEKGDLPDIYDGNAGKIFPMIGSGLMTIAAIEDVDLENGLHFDDCIKVQNQAGDYMNYYWYAREHGLVRYVIGASTESLSTEELTDGEIVGELNSTH